MEKPTEDGMSKKSLIKQGIWVALILVVLFTLLPYIDAAVKKDSPQSEVKTSSEELASNPFIEYKRLEYADTINLWANRAAKLPESEERTAFANSILEVIEDKKITDKEYEDLDDQMDRLMDIEKMKEAKEALKPITEKEGG